MTGVEPQCVIPSYFRNKYFIFGIITVDRTVWLPLLFAMGEENHDAADFVSFVVNAVARGWIRRGDFLVIDNAWVHSSGSADMLPYFLWNATGLDGLPLHILIVPYPTMAPELNPIKLWWGTYIERSTTLHNDCFASINVSNVNLKNISSNALSTFTHNDVEKNYVKCGYYGSI